MRQNSTEYIDNVIIIGAISYMLYYFCIPQYIEAGKCLIMDSLNNDKVYMKLKCIHHIVTFGRRALWIDIISHLRIILKLCQKLPLASLYKTSSPYFH